MAENYIQIYHNRCAIYNDWNKALLKFLDSREFEGLNYNSFIRATTAYLRDIKDSVLELSIPPEYSELIEQIETLEEQHLLQTVKYHQNQVKQIPTDRQPILEIEEEINDLIEELIPS